MRTMRLISALALGTLFAHANVSASQMTGRFTGTGRACYGTLTIAKKTISWNTAFSHCKPRSFRLAEETSVDGKRRLTFTFSETVPACRFQVISLTHDEKGGEDTGWEATGYANLASYQADKRNAYTRNAPDMMSCALVRDPERDKRAAK